ncbi:D-2-hydroxyacid dehydrogenase [uncultured Sphaerochaeta sp.]|uniref:D-2-hydroxyacid dehydrogenase n=1 Tax=uncultured Sphaerochaeta sp. TaxID=886478 RepID=UPI002A0A7A7D|nr:D-2-hydroxyacid dehydrogenase [uncultured Sphaerochaeta sp.]
MMVSTLGLNENEKTYMDSLVPNAVVHTKLDCIPDSELALIEVVISYGYDLSQDRIERMTNLKWIHIGQSGMEYLSSSLLQERNIQLTNSRGINASNIAEHVICAMLNHVRKTFVYRTKQLEGTWDTETRMGELRDTKLGVLGLGMAGREVVKRALAFNMHVLGMDIAPVEIEGVQHFFQPHQVKELLSICDFVVLTMPLTKNTHHIINAETLSVVKDGAFLINCGRGGLVDIEALKVAIASGALAGASLDVFEKEPLEKGDELWTWNPEKLEITPHIAGDHFEAYGKRMIEVLAKNLSVYPNFDAMQNKVDIKWL